MDLFFVEPLGEFCVNGGVDVCGKKIVDMPAHGFLVTVNFTVRPTEVVWVYDKAQYGEVYRLPAPKIAKRTVSFRTGRVQLQVGVQHTGRDYPSRCRCAGGIISGRSWRAFPPYASRSTHVRARL